MITEKINSITINNFVSISKAPFYWNIIMDDGSEINTTSYNQTVDIILLDNCSTFTNVLYNYTVYDEETKLKLANTTIEINLNLFDSSRILNILNFSQLYSNINPVGICMNGTLLTNVNYSADSVVKYSSNDTTTNISYATEYYNILGGIISNKTIPNNISLYDLNDDDSTEFQLTFRDSSFSLASNILINLYRQYISDGDFKVVEIPLTDSSGQAILHMVRNDVVYNIIMVDEQGNILDTFNQFTAFCDDATIGLCTIRLNARGEEDIVYNYNDDLGISYENPTYSSVTGLVSFSFVSDDLSSKEVRVDVIRNSAFGNRSVCSESLTSSTGIITCDVSSVSDTDRFFFINIFVDGNLMIQPTIDLEAEDFNFGIVNGAFYAFLMILFLITMFMEDKQVLVLALVFGWAAVIGLGLINGKFVGSATGGVWLIISVIILLWKLNKEEGG